MAAKLRRDDPQRTYPPQDIFAGWRKRLGLPKKEYDPADTTLPPVSVKAVSLGTSRIVEIICESWNPNLSADYANGLASEYIEYNVEALGESTGRVSAWLNKQVQEARAQLEQSENQLHEYTQEMNLVYTGDSERGSVEDQKLRDLQEDLAKATAERIMKQAAYQIAKSSSVEAVPRWRRTTG